MPSRPSEYRKRPAPPPARSEQSQAKHSFPFRRKNQARAHQEKRRMFCLAASVSERRRGGFIRRRFPENAFGFRSGCGALEFLSSSAARPQRLASSACVAGG
ncbi:hypothetical protein A2926_02605 [Candidatus Giovannonibacteria bacterium RIFCSPLOWO2_01_FULL_44_40]|nr:MAG: hypothetical protein A2926_02605 [Candidatus Giovannonibacteria bacterium RIFCSPLOWO2_01_FULL_44_40]